LLVRIKIKICLLIILLNEQDVVIGQDYDLPTKGAKREDFRTIAVINS